MSCSQTLTAIQLDCNSSIGGIKKVWIGNYNETSFSGTGDTVTATGTFIPFEFRKQTGSLSSTLNVEDAAGSNYVTSELVLRFSKMDTNKRLQIAALSKTPLRIVVEDNNGEKFALGVDNYVSASGGNGNTGTNFGDSNEYSITLKDESKEMPKLVTGEIPE